MTDIGGVDMSNRRARVTVPLDHPLATRSGKVRRYRLVLWEHLDGEGAPCHWCGRDLVWRVAKGIGDTLNVDHLNGDPSDDRIENLVPSCKNCNAGRAKFIDNRTHCKNGHPWEGNLYVSPNGKNRYCSQCRRDRR